MEVTARAAPSGPGTHATTRRLAGSADWLRWLVWALPPLLTIWTVLIAADPLFRFNVRWPGARLPIETASVAVALLAATLAYLRYSIDGTRSFLFVGLGFLALAVSRLGYGLFLAERATQDARLYAWTAGWLVGGTCLLIGGLSSNLRRPASERPERDLVVGVAAVVAVLAALEGIVAIWGGSLPALSRAADPRAVSATPAALVLGLAGALLFLVAAVRYWRVGSEGAVFALTPALILAAFSHVHYVLQPTVFSDRVSTGEILRLAFSGALVVGLVYEVRRAYVAERDRNRELESAYRSERRRAAALEAADRSRVRLIAVLAHEFVQPVVAIRATALALMKRWPDIGEDERTGLLRALDVQSTELRTLTDRLPADIVSDQPFEVIRQRRAVVDLFDELATAVNDFDRPLRVRLSDAARAASVDVDPPRLIQVMRNLVGNADKFSPRGRPVEVDVGAVGDDVLVSVIDEGDGIAEGEEQMVFRPFVRASSVEGSDVDGSGLGLYVVEGIVQGHGGRIWWERTADGRSAFRFTLPVAAEVES